MDNDITEKIHGIVTAQTDDLKQTLQKILAKIEKNEERPRGYVLGVHLTQALVGEEM